jgi:hypothetical protein
MYISKPSHTRRFKTYLRIEGALVGLLAILIITGCSSGIPSDPVVNDEDEPGDVETAREIEEADIVKLIDGYFYISNPYTGLRVIDATNISEPRLAGSYVVRGRGVELIVRDDHVFLFTAADFGYCAGEPVTFDDPAFGDITEPDYEGTRLWVVDVSNKDELGLVGTVDFDGIVVGTRRVGEILYATGTIGSTTFVVSIDISDPAHISVVESLRFGADAEDIHVSQEAIFLYGDDLTEADTTRVTYVDISSTNGFIERRDSFRVPGTVRDRYSMDADADTFRIVTQDFNPSNFTQTLALYIYDISDADNVERLAVLPVTTQQTLRTVRFDRQRAYLVSSGGDDPLYVLDLSDPANPTVSGELAGPGFSTHLVPLGDRLLGVGFTSGAAFEPAVSLYDVSDLANPTLLSRIVVESLNRFSVGSEATVDEKALGVLNDLGIVLLPYAVFDRDSGDFIDGLQIIQMTGTNLRERGQIEHQGIVRRSGFEDSRMWLLSEVAFATVNAIDLDAPQQIAELTLISEQELLDAGLTNCVDSARLSGRSIFYFEGNTLCGTFVPFSTFLTMAGLIAIRIVESRSNRNRPRRT